MTVGAMDLPPEGMLLGGVSLAGDPEKGVAPTDGLSLLFTASGITVQGPQEGAERLLAWSGLESASCREQVQLPDGSSATQLVLTASGQTVRFTLAPSVVSPGQAAYLDQALPAWLHRYSGTDTGGGKLPNPVPRRRRPPRRRRLRRPVPRPVLRPRVAGWRARRPERTPIPGVAGSPSPRRPRPRPRRLPPLPWLPLPLPPRPLPHPRPGACASCTSRPGACASCTSRPGPSRTHRPGPGSGTSRTRGPGSGTSRTGGPDRRRGRRGPDGRSGPRVHPPPRPRSTRTAPSRPLPPAPRAPRAGNRGSTPPPGPRCGPTRCPRATPPMRARRSV